MEEPNVPEEQNVTKATKRHLDNSLTNEWKKLGPEIPVLFGNVSQAHKKFKGHNQQASAIAVVACAFAQIKKMKTWKRDTLDKIIEVGDVLHHKSVSSEQNKCREFLQPKHIYKYFYLGSTQISMKTKEKPVCFKIIKDVHLYDSLATLLLQFFAKYNYGIVMCRQQIFTIWQYNAQYFFFDSTDHEENGDTWTGPPGLGVSLLVRFPVLEKLGVMLAFKLSLKHTNLVCIIPCELEKAVRINTKPPEILESDKAKIGPASALQMVVEQFPPSKKEPRIKPKPPEEPPPKEETPPQEGEETEDQATEEEIPPKPEPSESMIPPQRPYLETPTKFQELDNFSILYASTHQNDPKFTRNPCSKDLANALAALCVLRLYKSKFWNKKILNEVLKLGEILYHEVRNLPKNEAYQVITFEEKKYSPEIVCTVVGSLLYDEPNVIHLSEALTNQLIDNDCAIVTVKDKTVAVWREDDHFYMYEPNPCDKNGSVISDVEGKACVMCFSDVLVMGAKLIRNISMRDWKVHFILKKVVINDYVELAEDWFAFKALSLNKWILRGTISQQDRRFPEDSRNSQCVAMAAMSLAYKEWIEEKDWNSDTIDDILVKGDEYYHACVEALEAKGLFKKSHLLVDELNRSFNVENKKFMLEIDDCVVNGIVNSEVPEILNLETGFVQFFGDCDTGIVTANDQAVAVWKKADDYFYFDSHSRDREGIACAFGTACLLRLLSIHELTRLFLTNMKADRINMYNINRIDIKMVDITDDGIVKPPLINYQEVNDYVAILRSNFHQKHQKFDSLHRGNQTVPNCLAAIAMNMLVPSDSWKQEDLDQILDFGDQFYTDSMQHNYEEPMDPELDKDEISTDNVLKKLTMGTNSFDIEFEEHNLGNFEENLKDALETLSATIAEQGNENFQSIIESPLLTVSLWRDDNLFYLFDPQPRDEHGQVYGKDEWSAKIEESPEQQDEDNVENVEKESPNDENNPEDEAAQDTGLNPPVDQPAEEIEQKPEVLESEEIKDAMEKEEEEFAEGGEGEGGPAPPEKHDSLYWRIQEEQSGKACVLRFSRMEDLLNHLIENIPPNKRQDTEYVWKLVKMNNTLVTHELPDPEIEEKDEMVENWCGFYLVDRGKWILRGTRTMYDSIYLEDNRGKQQIPMCITALGIASIYHPKWFHVELVDHMMDYGDRLLSAVKRRKRLELQTSKDRTLTDDEIEDLLNTIEFDILHFPVKFCLYRKLLWMKPELGVVSGDISSTIPEEVPNLPTGLTNLFKHYQYAILTCKGYTVSIWQCGEFFYMFDPHECGPSGYASPIGVCCVTRYAKLEDLAEVYLKNLPKIGEHFFVVHALGFEHDVCPIGYPPDKPTEEVPKGLGGFVTIMIGKHILRGSVHRKCENFSGGVHIHSYPIALVALALSLAKDPVIWTKLMVDAALLYGEEIFVQTLQKLGDKFDYWHDTLNLRHIDKDIQMGAIVANWDVEPYDEICGQVEVNMKFSKALNLRQGFDLFFERYTHGILVIQRFCWAIWEQYHDEQRYIYLFDPNSRGPTGLPTHGGAPCVMRFWMSKLAADHVKACLLTSLKVKTKFHFIPIDIIVGTKRTHRKKTCQLTPTKKKDEPSPKPYTGTPVTCPKKVDNEAMNRMKKTIVMQIDHTAELKRCLMLGRNKMYDINHLESLLRGLRPLKPNTDVAVNFIAFLLFFIKRDIENWDWSFIEKILQYGELLHIDSIVAYGLKEKKLLLTEVLKSFEFLNVFLRLKVFRPVALGECTQANVAAVLEVFFAARPCFLFTNSDFLVTLCFRGGYYYMFDPYNRNIKGDATDSKDGTAVVMRFANIESLACKLVKNLTKKEEGIMENFSVIIIEILPADYVSPDSVPKGMSTSVSMACPSRLHSFSYRFPEIPPEFVPINASTPIEEKVRRSQTYVFKSLACDSDFSKSPTYRKSSSPQKNC